MFRAWLPILALLPASASAAAADAPARPRLLFAAGDLPALRQRIGSGIAAGAYAQMKKEADGLLALRTQPYTLHGAVAGRALAYQALTLALTGHLSGERAYLDKAAAVLCAAAEQRGPDDLARENGHLAVGDALHAYAIGYDWVEPTLTPAQRALLREEIRAFGQWLFEHSRTDPFGEEHPRRLAWNHNAVAHANLGLAALVLGDRPEWLARAAERVRGYLTHAFDETGAPYEGLSYLGYGLHSAIPMAIALRRQGGPDLLAEAPALRHVPAFLTWHVLPRGGQTVAHNQSSSPPQPQTGYFYLLNQNLDGVGLWAWLRLFGPEAPNPNGSNPWMGSSALLPYVVLWADPDLRPRSPAEVGWPLSAVFARGQAAARDGWGDLDSLVTFTCGTGIQGCWNHGDAGSFTFHARGEAFAVDPGAGWGKPGEHNTVLIDGVGQWSDGGPNITEGKLPKAEERGGSFYLLGDATAAYRRKQPVRHARRQIHFVRAPQPYLLVADDIEKDDAAHDYSWLLYSGEGNRVVVDADGRGARIAGARRGAVAEVRFVWPPEGLHLAAALAKGKLPLLTATARAVNPRFVALLIARNPEEPAPEIAREGGPEGMSITLRFPGGRTDRLRVSPGNIELVSGGG